MQFTIPVLTTCLGLFALCQVSLALIERPVEDYLIFLDSTAAYEDEFQWISEQLEQSAAQEPEKLSEIIHQKLDLVREARKENNHESIDHPQHRLIQLEDVLDQFAHLTEPVESWDHDCRVVSTLQHFLDALDIVFGGLDEFNRLIAENKTPEENGKLFIFMKHYGLSHLNQCLAALIEGYQLEAQNGPWDDEHDLDMLLTPSAEIENVNDLKLLETANNYDFNSDDFADFLTLKSLENTYSSTLGDNTAAERALSFSCAGLKLDLANVFVTYDVARALIPEETQLATKDLDARFHKLDEYFRLCNEARQH